MRKLYIILFLLLNIFSLSTLGKLEAQENTPLPDEDLVSLAKNISIAFGPDYCLDNIAEIEISNPIVFKSEDQRPEIQSRVGNLYFEVTFYPEDRDMFDYEYISKVAVWMNGEPMEVIYGNGWGVNFLFTPYDEMIKDPELITIPLEYAEQ